MAQPWIETTTKSHTGENKYHFGVKPIIACEFASPYYMQSTILYTILFFMSQNVLFDIYSSMIYIYIYI